MSGNGKKNESKDDAGPSWTYLLALALGGTVFLVVMASSVRSMQLIQLGFEEIPAQRWFEACAVHKLVPVGWAGNVWVSSLRHLPLATGLWLLIRLALALRPKKEDQPRSVEDLEYELWHNGVDTPKLKHLDDLLACCGEQPSELRENIAKFNIPTVTPAIKMTRIDFTPSEEQIKHARDNYKTAKSPRK